MISPQAERMKQQLAEFAARLAGQNVAGMREVFRTFSSGTTRPPGVAWTRIDAGGVPGIWADADGGALNRAILYLHGGGYVMGDAQAYRYFTGHLARAAGCRVLSVDYRLAPEHPHPAAVQDAVRAYRWLLQQGWEPAHLAIAGDSAGGGLSLATLLALRDQGMPLPAAGLALSPWTDLEATGTTMTSNAPHDVMIQRPALLALAGLFLNGHDPREPHASPLHGDFTGLPPLYIQVGGQETLLDDSRRVADSARKAGVAVTLEIFPHMQHVFQAGVGTVPEADDAMRRIGTYLRSRLATEPGASASQQR